MAVWLISSRMVALRRHRPMESCSQLGFARAILGALFVVTMAEDESERG
jgi:hypothetical protein